MSDRVDDLRRRHRRLNRIIDNCRAASRQEELKVLKRIRLRLKDRLVRVENRVPMMSG